MLRQLPLDNLAVWHEVQHAVHQRTEIPKHLHHLRLGPRRGVGGRDTLGEVYVRLCAGQVVDGLVGHGVRDDVPLFADPPHHAVTVKQRQHLRVVRHVFALEHDAVRRLARVGLAELLADLVQETRPRGRLDAVRGEHHVGLDLVAVAVVGLDREDGFWGEGVDVNEGGAELEFDGGLLKAGVVDAAREGGPVPRTVWVSVFLLNVWHVHVG